jgi:hypothetical protein
LVFSIFSKTGGQIDQYLSAVIIAAIQLGRKLLLVTTTFKVYKIPRL